MKFQRNGHIVRRLCLALAALWLGSAHASPEEIVIFDDKLEKPGDVGYEVHLNYEAHARREATYPGETPPQGIVRFMPELSYGISRTWELGLHLPMSGKPGGTTLNGFKARLTNVNQRETDWGSWFYGANYELSYFDKRVSEARTVAEVRGIIGLRRGGWLFVLNPILGRDLSSHMPELDKQLQRDINFKTAKTIGEHLALGIEHYSQVGKFERPRFGGESAQITYAVVEFKTRSRFEFHLGLGHGWNDPIDKFVVKTIVGIPF